MNVEKFDTTWVSLTYNCNNRCSWCYAASNLKENRSKKLDPVNEDGIIDLMSDLGVRRTILIGGEPTLYPNLYGFLEKLSEKEIQSGMVTNGRRLADKSFVRNLKQRGLNYLSVSIEGYNAETHDSTTRIKGSYNEAISGLKNASSEGINVSTNTVINSSNLNDLEKIVESLMETGVNNLGFNIEGVCVSNEDNNSKLVNPRIASKAFADLYIQFKDKANLNLVTPVPLCFFEENLRSELTEKKIISGGPCQLVHGKNFVIDYNGDVLPCTHLTGFPEFNLFESGKIISKDRFLEIYNNPKGLPHQFRNKLSNYPSAQCSDCSESCSGGCPLIWSKFDPEIEIGGPNA